MTSRNSLKVKKRAGLALLALFVIFAGFLVISFGKYLPVLYELFFKKEIELHQTKDSRVNILILGIGGGKHEGPNLTDTIIFTTIDPRNKKMTLVSIPRDLWVPDLRQKINYAYASGEAKKEGGGLTLAKAVVEKILNQQVDYSIRIDFNGFIKAVDMIGGLDVTVDNTFDDNEYPISGKEEDPCEKTEEEILDLTEQIATGSATGQEAFPCRYEHLHFDKGPMHMDGETALKFVRSRHAEGIEGSDFARSQRQEKIISAFKDKILSADTFLNPVKVVSLATILKDSIDTDIKSGEYDDFVKLAKKMRGAKVVSAVVDAGDDGASRPGLLMNPPITEEFNNTWVLIPRLGSGKYVEIQDYVKCQIGENNCIVGEQGVLTATPQPKKNADSSK